MASTPRGNAAQRPNGSAQGKICQFKLVLLGESAVGKSSLVLRFVKGQFHEFQESTIGAAFLTQTVCMEDTAVKFESKLVNCLLLVDLANCFELLCSFFRCSLGYGWPREVSYYYRMNSRASLMQSMVDFESRANSTVSFFLFVSSIPQISQLSSDVLSRSTGGYRRL